MLLSNLLFDYSHGDLGIIFDNDLKFDQHLSHCAQCQRYYSEALFQGIHLF